MSEPAGSRIRLAKRVVELTRCSRSEAERYIEGGWVRVDGVIVELPQAMVGDEPVEIDPKATLEPLEPATIIVHKAAGDDVSAASERLVPEARWAEDPSGIRLLRKHRANLVPVMPLEAQASGLLAFTQDPRAVRRLSQDAERIEEEYVVEVSGPGTELEGQGPALEERRQTIVARLCGPFDLDGRRAAPCKASWQSEARLRFAGKAIAPGQLARMCADVGLGVVSLKRIRVGRISLGKMPVGQWRYLTSQQRF